jgi:hypothetical protein
MTPECAAYCALTLACPDNPLLIRSYAYGRRTSGTIIEAPSGLAVHKDFHLVSIPPMSAKTCQPSGVCMFRAGHASAKKCGKAECNAGVFHWLLRLIHYANTKCHFSSISCTGIGYMGPVRIVPQKWLSSAKSATFDDRILPKTRGRERPEAHLGDWNSLIYFLEARFSGVSGPTHVHLELVHVEMTQHTGRAKGPFCLRVAFLRSARSLAKKPWHAITCA